MKKTVLSRRLKSGIYSIVISIAMLLAVVGFNLVVSLLPDSAVKIDTTTEGLFTLSDQTNRMLKDLDEDITIYLIVEPGKEDDYVVNMLERYAQTSEHITVEHINPLINPTFTAGYTEETVENNGVIVAGAKRSTVVQKTDMYSYGFDYTYYTSSTVFEGETKLTGAVNYVTNTEVKVIALTTGHGEAEFAESMKESAVAESFELKTVNITAGSLDDADAVVMLSPVMDITPEEKQLLSDYLDGGGKFMLLSSFVEGGLKNVYELMASFGLEPENGIVIEGDANHSISGYPYYLLADLEEHDITDPLREAGVTALMPAAMGVKETDTHRSTLRVMPLMTTSENAYLKVDPYGSETFDFEQGDVKGSFNLAMAATEEFAGNTIKVIWYGSTMMADGQVDEIISGNNSDVLINSFAWLTDAKSGINVRAKSTVTPYLTVTTAFKTGMTVLICAVIPLAIIAIGAVIAVRRRRRK